MTIDHSLRDRISKAVTEALRPLPAVFAGWEGGSAADPDHCRDIERHGDRVPLFDKGNWLRPRPLDEGALGTQREQRYQELQTWFPMGQVFVRKAILRGQHVEAVNAFWACTLKPLAELLRMRYCPVRWDFGVRYLDRVFLPLCTCRSAT